MSETNSLWIARIVSVVLHPIWIPIGCLFIDIPPKNIFLTELLTLTGSLVLLPGLISWYFLRREKEADMFVVAWKNREITLIALSAGIAAGMFALVFIPFSTRIGIMLLSVAPCLLAAMVATIWDKVSLHMMGWGYAFPIAIIWPLEGMLGDLVPILLLAATAIVYWARIRLASHNHAQMIEGYIIGAATVPFLWLLLFVTVEGWQFF